MRLIFWALFALMLGVYLTMLIWSAPIVSQAADGLVLFDIRPMGYSFSDAEAFLAALPDDARLFYLNVQQGLDSVYPALFAVVMVMAFVHLLRGVYQTIAIAFALAGAGFDYLENAAVAGMLRSGAGGLSPEMVAKASQWTMLKSGAVTLALLALIAGLVIAFVDWRKAQRAIND